MADNEVTIKLTVEGNAKVQIDKATKSVEEFSQKATKGFTAVSGAFAVFAGNLASAAFQRGLGFLTRGIESSARAFLEFDKAVAEVNSLLPANVKLTKATTDAFIEFSSQFGGTAQQQAKAFYQIVSAGITDTVKATTLLEAANRAAVAGVTDVRVAVDALTSVINAYGSETISTTQASDILFTAIKEGKTTFDELSSTIGRVNPIAASAGVNFDEVAGTLAFLTKSGVSTDEAVTSLRAAIASIIKPTAEQVKQAKALGIEFTASALKAKGFAGFMADVTKAAGGNAEQLTKLFPNIRAVTAVASIAGKNFQEFKRILGETATATGATSDAFAKIAESASFQFETLMSSIQNIGLELFQELEPVFEIVLSAAKDAVTGFKDIQVNGSAVIGTIDAILAAADLMARTFTLVFNVIKSGLSTIATIIVGELALIVTALDKVANAIPGLESPFKELKDTLSDLSKTLLEETVASTEAAFTAFSEDTTISGFRDKLREATQGSRELAEAQTELQDTLDENKDRTLERDEELAESKLTLAEAELKLLDSVIKGADTAIEKERKKFEQIVAINGKTIADKKKLVQAIDAQAKKITELENKELKKREAEENRVANQRLNAASKAFGDLAVLSSSKNKELAAIGKASAIAQTTIDTYRAAQGAYAALSSIPFIGPALGIAAAAAAIIAGLARVAQIRGTPLQQGITSVPGIGTQDNFPAVLAPQERVVTAEQNQDLTDFLVENQGQNAILLDIRDRLNNLENQVTVNIGSKEIADELLDIQRSGRSLEVA